MDQSESNNKKAGKVEIPARTFTVEFFVGLFAIFGIGAVAYLCVGLGGLKIGGGNSYEVIAEFDNISGLEKGASVEVAGVPIGEVADIRLKDPIAQVVMLIEKGIKLRDDDIISIRTKGIIGDRYVKVSRGASETFIANGGIATETESVVDIEDLIGKFVHNFGNEETEL